MASVTLWLGTLTEEASEGDPESWTLAFFDGRASFLCWSHDMQVLLQRFAGKSVRIAIEEAIPLRTSLKRQEQQKD